MRYKSLHVRRVTRYPSFSSQRASPLYKLHQIKHEPETWPNQNPIHDTGSVNGLVWYPSRQPTFGLQPADGSLTHREINTTVPTPDTSQKLRTAQADLIRLTAELTTERAISARFFSERDDAVSATRLATAELATEKEITARLLQQHDRLRAYTRQHVQLSSYLGEYTSAFLVNKTLSERAALMGAIQATTKLIWDSGAGLSWVATTKAIRVMMGQHGFVFREPGEGKTGWGGYAIMVPDVGVLEQLDGVVRTHRAELGAEGWYLNELTSVLVLEYLENNT